MSHSIEIQIIESIQPLRGPVLDAFFKFLDLFDRQEFFFVLIPHFTTYLQFFVIGLWAATGSLLLCRQFLPATAHRVGVEKDA